MPNAGLALVKGCFSLRQRSGFEISKVAETPPAPTHNTHFLAARFPSLADENR
jgi:hypothetical protein